MRYLRQQIRKHRGTLATALPGVLLALAATWWFLFRGPAPAVGHVTHVRPDTAVCAVLCPARVQSYVSGLAPTATRFVRGIPRLSSMQGGPIRFDWLHKMPLEMAFLFDQAFPGRFGVTLFFQENPTGEPLDDLVDNSAFLADLRPIEWSSSRLRREPNGQLLAEGQLTIPPDVQEQAGRIWSQYQPVETPAIRGNHFLEIGINNCNGALMQLQGALMNLFVPWADAQLQQSLQLASVNVLNAHATADLAQDDRLEFQVKLTCTDPGSAQGLAEVGRVAAAALSAHLATQGGFVLEGTFTTDRAQLVAEYVLSGFEARLRRALGG